MGTKMCFLPFPISHPNDNEKKKKKRKKKQCRLASAATPPSIPGSTTAAQQGTGHEPATLGWVQLRQKVRIKFFSPVAESFSLLCS
jgi:hypothetical protein